MEVPAFLTAAAHPVRWRLLAELSASDRPVQELTALVEQPQNLVSYHLGLLHKANLVARRRSSADGRAIYYSLDLVRCRDLLAAAGAALHPGLFSKERPRPSGSVLFLCTGNSSRSQMAEALLRHRTGGAVRVRSAGSRPKPVHAEAVAVMAECGIDISGARSKHLDEFVSAGDAFDHVITLCDRVREVCPEFPGHPRTVHWSIPEPDDRPAFVRVAAELTNRIEFLEALL